MSEEEAIKILEEFNADLLMGVMDYRDWNLKFAIDLAIGELKRRSEIEKIIKDYSTPTSEGTREIDEKNGLECMKKIVEFLNWKVKEKR